jgi:two-component system, OmpR family, sensor histidine kinase MtrB
VSGIGSSVDDRAPHRFRRRLTAAFLIVAAVSAGVVAVVTFVLAREYRWRNFRAASLREARIALAFAPRDLDHESFTRLREAYEQRSEADMIASQGGRTFSSSPSRNLSDVPPSLVARDIDQEPAVVEDVVDGRDSLVVAAEGPAASRYYFFFSLEQLRESLGELGRVAAAGWAVTVVLAGAVGQVVARQTLRPVAAAAEAAEAIAGGDLDARLEAASRDEFGALAASFNHMADELKELIDQLNESAERERRFTADVAHELRTPLTGMSASASVLAEHLDDLPSSLRRVATVLVADVHRLRDLVLELLELSRLDRGTEPVLAEPLRLSDAVAAVVASAHLRRDAGIEIDLPDGLSVLAEPHRLRRILANLLDNAIVHGGGRVRISAEADGADVLVNVVDHGPGIAAGDEERVFDRFFKSDASRAATGSGLGLSIARQHALAQHGELFLGDASAGATCFTLRLPAAAPPATEVRPHAVAQP